jgi:hypothetical protein
MELQEFSGPSGRKLFLISSLLFPEGEDGFVSVVITIDGDVTVCPGQIFQGRQRVLLPSFTADIILQAIEEKKQLSFSVRQ